MKTMLLTYDFIYCYLFIYCIWNVMKKICIFSKKKNIKMLMNGHIQIV